MRSRSLVVLGMAAGIALPVVHGGAAKSGQAESSQFADTQKALTEIANEANRLQAETGSGLELPVGIINNPDLPVPTPLPAPTANRRTDTTDTANRRSPGWLLEARDASEAADRSPSGEATEDNLTDEDTRAAQAQDELSRDTTTINPLDAYMADWLTDSDYRMLSDFNPDFSRDPSGGFDSNLGLGSLPSPTAGLTNGLREIAGLSSPSRSAPRALADPADNPFLTALEAPARPVNINPGVLPAPISSSSAGASPATVTPNPPEPVRSAAPASPLRPPVEPDYFPQLNRF